MNQNSCAVIKKLNAWDGYYGEAFLSGLNTNSVPQEPAVYFISAGDECLYVGKASNLRGRTLASDYKGQSLHSAVFRARSEYPEARLVWVLVPKSAISVLEEALIWALNPKWNSVGKRR